MLETHLNNCLIKVDHKRIMPNEGEESDLATCGTKNQCTKS